MRFALSLALLALAAPLAAKDSLGVFGKWGAFRDDGSARCYAISAAEIGSGRRDFAAFASVGTWPEKRVRGQVHFRLSRALGSAPRLRLVVGGDSFELTGSGSNAWAPGGQQDAAIVAALRAGSRMSVSATDNRGNRFTDRYSLDGAATALDAANVGCARR